MPLEIVKGYRQLVAEAEKEIETISIHDALGLHGNDDVVFVEFGHVVDHGPHERLLRDVATYRRLVEAFEADRATPIGGA